MKATKIVAFALAVPLALALAALLVAVGLTAANTDFSNPADLKEFARNKMAKAGIPALSVAYIRGGKIFSAWALGKADPERGIPADEETIFQIASVSKTVTATAAMQLAERGLIDLDADIDRYLPFAVDHPAHPDALISARMLLAHRSGIADNWGVYNPLYTIGAGGGDSPIGLEEFLRSYLVEGGARYDARKNFTAGAPGEEFSYSNVAFGLVGLLVESVDGRSFDRYCAEELFAPLDMPSTVWLHRDADAGRMALPCDDDGKPLPPYSFPTYPDGALKTTPTEFARFLAASMDEGRYGSFSMLRPETMREMLRPQFGNDEQALGWSYSTLSDLMLRGYGDRRIAGHGGGDPGVLTLALFNPEKRTGLVVFMNKAIELDFKLLNIHGLVKRLVDEADL